MRTEQLTKCCEPLLKMKVRLGPCKFDLSPQLILYYLSIQGDTSAMVLFVMCFGVAIVLFELCERFHSFSEVRVTGWLSFVPFPDHCLLVPSYRSTNFQNTGFFSETIRPIATKFNMQPWPVGL